MCQGANQSVYSGFKMNWEKSLKVQARAFETVLGNRSIKTQVKRLISISKNTTGFHYFTGVGKNSFIAQKIAATYNSLGIRSMFMDPGNALHGDMNMFTKDDVVIAISKSGETSELITFEKALIRISPRSTRVAITSASGSTLSKLSNCTVTLPVAHEGDHLNLAPMSSTLVYMGVLQAIAVDLSSSKKFSKYDFMRSHPGGSIGERGFTP